MWDVWDYAQHDFGLRCPMLHALLQADLAAAESKRTDVEGKLSTAQADAKSAKSEVDKLQKKLTSTTSSLETTQSKLSKAESDLVAAKTAVDEASSTGSSCKLSLKKAESRISEQASRLEELKAVEEALLPVWLSRRLIQAQTFTAQQWKALQESDLAAQAAAKVTPYYEQATAAVAPHWEKAMEVTQPAREKAAVYYKQAKVSSCGWPRADTFHTRSRLRSRRQAYCSMVTFHMLDFHMLYLAL